jgi:hypothetical protein
MYKGPLRTDQAPKTAATFASSPSTPSPPPAPVAPVKPTITLTAPTFPAFLTTCRTVSLGIERLKAGHATRAIVLAEWAALGIAFEGIDVAVALDKALKPPA